MGYFESDPAPLHSPNWQEAYTEAERVLEEMLPRQAVDELEAALAEVATREPEEVLFRGYGWGALEKRRAGKSGEDSGIPPELPFDDDDLGEDQEPWLRLLETGVLPERNPQEDPGQFQTQEEWRRLLEESISSGKSDHWLGWLHLGVMKMEAGDPEGAREAWGKSLERAPNGWALRNLSVLRTRAGDQEAAADLLAQAVAIGPVIPALVGEYASLLLKLKRFDDLDSLLRGLPQEVREAERLRMAAAWVALHFDRFGEVQEALQQEFATIREGELTLSELWFALQEKKLALAEGVEITDELRVRVRRDFPPPYEIDFRMSQEGDDKYVPPQATGG
jgi:tetratricopeptide (TPR) repeat protein